MSDPKPPFGLQELRREYAAGHNLMALMRRGSATGENDETSILYSYDLQAGSYIASLRDPRMADLKRRTGRKLADLFVGLGASVICEAGVGEATTLAELIAAMPPATSFFGFDISLSRLVYARRYLDARAARETVLFTAALGAIPLPDDSVDLLYTFHSIEPNGGRERELLTELLRVTQHHLVLVEPSNELGSQGTRAHIDTHAYAKDLRAHLDAMGCKVTRFEPWALDANHENEAALIVVEKRHRAEGAVVRIPEFSSPLTRSPMSHRLDCYFAEDEGLAFPVVAGIPCLLPANAIIATHLSDFE